MPKGKWNKDTIYNRQSRRQQHAMRPCLSNSSHLDHLGAVSDALQAFGVDSPILFAGQQLIPPAKEEITGDELEPWRE